MRSLLPIKKATVVLILLLSPTLLLSQTADKSNQNGAAPGQGTSPPNSAQGPPSQADSGAQPKPETQPTPPAQGPLPSASVANPTVGQQTKRILWIAPNFAAVSANTTPPPLTARGKFHLSFDDSVDYTSFVWAGMLAGQSMALRSYPELHEGAAGYARYYWRGFADQASGAFFTEALVPALTREDPRYYTLGHGSYFRRAIYSLAQVVLTRTDSGGTSFNMSEIFGNGLEAGLANAYYPPEERGMRKTMDSWGVGIESAAANNLVKEFWPDIHEALVRHLKR
jgi:hypothetical protein